MPHWKTSYSLEGTRLRVCRIIVSNSRAIKQFETQISGFEMPASLILTSDTIAQFSAVLTALFSRDIQLRHMSIVLSPRTSNLAACSAARLG